jgi:ubiquinone/menaquinone biosynthesis C-methylase UbiE
MFNVLLSRPEMGRAVSEYTIEQGPGVRDRMGLLAAVNGPATLALFDALGVPVSARCLDLGCGGGHVTMELARRAAPMGCAVGIDLDEALIEIARAEAAAQGLDNVTFQIANVETFGETGFDLAFARFLLMHLPDPEQTVAGMATAVRPGGMVVIEDANFAACFTYPRCAAYDSWVTWYRETVRRNGGDTDLGLRLPSLLRAAGLTNIGVRVAQPAYLDGPHKQLQQMSMNKMRTAVVAAGVTSAEEYDAAHAELKAFTADPTTLIAAPRMIQACGRRT